MSFGRTEKDTKIEKTYAPGPGSYQIHATVGAIQGYNKDDKNPRKVEEVPKKERNWGLGRSDNVCFIFRFKDS